jgi:ATP-binding cassette subfamily C (CFTR/MRP) protein 1
MLPGGWPTRGEIVFEGAELRYRPELAPALKTMTLTIPGGAHVGIVGRTGAGKSSMMSLLFRLVEPSAGMVKIDNFNIATLGLQRLRSAINIIPQDPILLEGTVRSNLDPFDQYGNAAVAAAIEKVMSGYSTAPATDGSTSNSDTDGQHGRGAITLDMSVSKDGANFSAGERQLLALARAMLYKRKIVS